MSAAPSWIRVARVGRPRGLSGELTVELLGGSPDRLVPGLRLQAPLGELVLEAARGEGSQLICRFRGIEDRPAAAPLAGAYLEVQASQLRALAPGEYFHFQLVGLAVEDPAGRLRGELVEVEAYPAHDVYLVRDSGSELRVPAVREAVLAIDLDGGRMVVADRFLEDWVDAV